MDHGLRGEGNLAEPGSGAEFLGQGKGAVALNQRPEVHPDDREVAGREAFQMPLVADGSDFGPTGGEVNPGLTVTVGFLYLDGDPMAEVGGVGVG